MKTCSSRVAVIVWAETMTSQDPPVRAGMIVSKTVGLTTTVRPMRAAISRARSMSEPMALSSSSRYSCGGYGMSEQIVSVPAVIS